MKEFTKEQLIEQAQKNIAVLRGAAERIPGASDAAVIHLRLAEITLAALTAEPVSWTDEVELRDVEANGFAYLFTVNPITPHADPRRIIKLYKVQPAMESRTVTVKLYDDFQLCHYGTTEDYAKGYINCQNNFTKWLTAAGIQVIEGDA